MWTRRLALALVALLPSIALLSILGCGSVGDNSPTAVESATASSTSLFSAADITVNSTVDVSDFGGAQQVADLPGSDGLVSLREAIIAANNTTGPQVIGFNVPTSDAGFDGTAFTIRPLSELPPMSGGSTTIDGTSQSTFSGNTNPAGPEIVLNGGLSCNHGLFIISANNVVHGLVINGFGSSDPDACGRVGILITTPQANGNVVSGCFIGLDASGTTIAGNEDGVVIENGATNNLIGGASSAERNLVSGNVSTGIVLASDDNVVLGNFIGTDVTGTVALGNQERDGIAVFPGSNNLIKGNIISGNGLSGIRLSELSSGNLVRDNLLGTDVTGTIALGNREDGIRVFGDGNTILGNLISGNAVDGVGFYAADDNVVRNNRIGMDVNGYPSLGNGEHGVVICCGPSTGNRIEDNLIAGNVQEGVAIFEGGLRNLISRNRILGNGLLGIRLGDGGPLPNDPGDADTGPNGLMNYPVLDLARVRPGQLIVRGTIDTQDPAHVVIEFFANPVPTPGGDPSGHGEGAVFLGSARPNAHGRFTATLPPVSLGTLITATATDASGNTSEFAANVEAVPPLP